MEVGSKNWRKSEIAVQEMFSPSKEETLRKLQWNKVCWQLLRYKGYLILTLL